MTYDRKSRTINIGQTDTPDDLKRDVYEYMADVSQQIAKDFPSEGHRPRTKGQMPGFKVRLSGLSRRTRVAFVLFFFWSAWVIFRSSGDYELLGYWLDDWDTDYFLLNWLGLPFFILMAYGAYCWVGGKSGPSD